MKIKTLFITGLLCSFTFVANPQKMSKYILIQDIR
jgi:hypothetical protein